MVTLINPQRCKFGIFERYVPLTVPLGIGSLAAFLIQNGEKATIIDEHIELFSLEHIKRVKEIAAPPYIFGISCLTSTVGRTIALSRFIKEEIPDAKIVVGGIHPTACPAEMLLNSAIDFVVRGEGEQVLLSLVTALRGKKDIQSIPGISFRENGKFINTQCAGLLDLSELPAFPYHLFAGHRDRYDLGFIVTSRGCPYECIFCSERLVQGRRPRYVPKDIVLNILKQLIFEYKWKHVTFIDDNFLMDKARLRDLLSGMIGEKFYRYATFDCSLRADSVDDEALSLLRRAGFCGLHFGIETASDRLLALVDKRQTVSEIIRAVTLAKGKGFAIAATLIYGLPTETSQERRDTFRLTKKLRLDLARFNLAHPFPGTKLNEIASKEGRLWIDKDWVNFNTHGTFVNKALLAMRLPYVPIGTSEEELKNDFIKANLLFSLQPFHIIKLLTRRNDFLGWFVLPKGWFFKRRELICFAQFIVILFFRLIRVMCFELKKKICGYRDLRI